MPFLNLYASTSVGKMALVENRPWEFAPDPEVLKSVRALPKEERRRRMLMTTTVWNVYTVIVGLDSSQRVSKDNPPVALRGFAADFDVVQSVETAASFIKALPSHLQPNFIEVTLGLKLRLLWVFETELAVANTEMAQAVLHGLLELVGAPTLLPGYDLSSSKPAQVWTNGGDWYEYSPTPFQHELVLGVACEAAKKVKAFSVADVPLDAVADEVQKRWPGRWTGEFREDSVGVRFWEEGADNPKGCQVKPDGMLCFTGRQPFVSWMELFGREWTETQKVLHIGKAATNLFYDGKNYWEPLGNRFVTLNRGDVILALKNRGLSDRIGKGVTASECDRVLRHIQVSGRVDGAAPLINYPPGVVEVDGHRLLNISTLKPVLPAESISGVPETDFPWLWHFLKNHFARPEHNPLDHFLVWLKRYYGAILNKKNWMGQALFLCGPKSNGKTLLCLRVVAPLVGNRYACPIDYFTGETQFNDDIFTASLLTINDEDAPKNDAARQRFAARIKAFVVNPTHTYHPKFCQRVTINWVGRIFATLNDDPASVAMLPEVNSNTEDKLMFFASQKYPGVWPDNEKLEKTIEAELPKFAKWLLTVFTPAPGIEAPCRTGMVSYFDPVVREMARQQVSSYNLVEMLQVWINTSEYWRDGDFWEGSPTKLMSDLSSLDTLAVLMKDWSVSRLAKALTSLAQGRHPGITTAPGEGRNFVLTKQELTEKP